MNKKINTNNRSFERAVMKVFPGAMKLKYIAIKTNNVVIVRFLSFQSNVSATANKYISYKL